MGSRDPSDRRDMAPSASAFRTIMYLDRLSKSATPDGSWLSCWIVELASELPEDLDSPNSHDSVPGWPVGPLHGSVVAMNPHDTVQAALTQGYEQNIVGRVEHFGEFPAQSFDLSGGHPAAEHRILNAMAVPFHVLRTRAQALLVVDVVAD